MQAIVCGAGHFRKQFSDFGHHDQAGVILLSVCFACSGETKSGKIVIE
jgi:hypothetical protein